MGLRQVSDLSEYTVPELLRLIRLATRVLKQKLTGEVFDPPAVWSDSDSGISVIDPPAAAANPTGQGQRQRASAQGGSTSSSARRVALQYPPPQRPLKNPWTCEFHCKYMWS